MSEFVDHLDEVFEEFSQITVLKIFGVHGAYRDGVIFALAANDILYLKADDSFAT